MTLQQKFELPTPMFGEVISHDMVYSKEQLALQAIVDGIGTRAVAKSFESDSDAASVIQSAETYGRYV